MISSQEISFIQEDLQKRGLTYQTLQVEILDHLCCVIEEKMDEGMSFQEAYTKSITLFGEEELPEIQSQTLKVARTSSPIWKRALVWTSSVAACLSFFMVFAGDGQAQNFPGISPLADDYQISNAYGMYEHPVYEIKEFHSGIDLTTQVGSKVQATANGVVEKITYQKEEHRWLVVIKHPEGLKTLYAGLQNIQVEEGQKIKQGDIIAELAQGWSQKKNILHYEIFWQDEPVDPKPYFTK